jgi:urate oxidase
MTSFLSHARYGKDKIRVFRVMREGEYHRVVEYSVTALLEGDIEVRWGLVFSRAFFEVVDD